MSKETRAVSPYDNRPFDLARLIDDQPDRFAPTERDGFRPRRKRTKAEMKQLIKDGIVRDPDAPPEASRFSDGPDVDYRDDAVIVRPESATMRGASREETDSGGSNR